MIIFFTVEWKNNIIILFSSCIEPTATQKIIVFLLAFTQTAFVSMQWATLRCLYIPYFLCCFFFHCKCILPHNNLMLMLTKRTSFCPFFLKGGGGPKRHNNI